MKLAIITSGYLPVPPTKGGAVESLIEIFLKENEKYKKIDITIFSLEDRQAFEQAKEYKKTKFEFIKPLGIIKKIDKLIYYIAKNIFKKKKTISYRYIIQRLYFLNNVSKKLKSENYDKILLENHATLFLALKWRKNNKKYKGRYFYHLHNEIKNTYGCEEIIKNTKKIICVSQYIIEQTIKKLKVIKPEQFVVLRNCVDENKFEKIYEKKEIENIKEKYNIEKHDKILLFIGRLTKDKGIKELLLAIKNIKTKNFKLLIVGSPFFKTDIESNEEKELKNIINDIKNKVIFTGFIPYCEIPIFYKIADVAILPSIWEDPAPLTIIESLKSGTPLITTYSGGIQEYVNEKCAIIIEKEDKEKMVLDLIKAIEKILNDEKMLKEMGKEGLEHSKNLTKKAYYFNFLTNLE